MTENSVHVWSWLVQIVGPIGAILVILASALVVLSSLITPFYLRRLHHKLHHIDLQLADIMANQSRQQQVDRLKNDRTRKRPRRRRS